MRSPTESGASPCSRRRAGAWPVRPGKPAAAAAEVNAAADCVPGSRPEAQGGGGRDKRPVDDGAVRRRWRHSAAARP